MDNRFVFSRGPLWRSPRLLPSSATVRDPVPDEIWDEGTRHYDKPALAALIIAIAPINVRNRLNVTTKQVTGEQRLGQGWKAARAPAEWHRGARSSRRR